MIILRTRSIIFTRMFTILRFGRSGKGCASIFWTVLDTEQGMNKLINKRRGFLVPAGSFYDAERRGPILTAIIIRLRTGTVTKLGFGTLGFMAPSFF